MSFSSVGLGVGRTNLVSQSVAKGNTAAITAKIKTGPYWSSTDAPPSTEPNLNTGSRFQVSGAGAKRLWTALPWGRFVEVSPRPQREQSSRTPKRLRRLGPPLLRMRRSPLRDVDGVRQH